MIIFRQIECCTACVVRLTIGGMLDDDGVLDDDDQEFYER